MHWKHYDNAVYWSLPDDGALFKCDSCGGYFNVTKVILTQIPKDDSRKVYCMDCIDEDWLEIAENKGAFNG